VIAKLAVLLAVVALVLFLRRRWTLRHRAAAIDSYPYARWLDKRLAARRPELSLEQRAEVFACLVEYFHLCRLAGRRMVAMPSQAVDDAWHEFILFTRHYDQFCRSAFGRFLHHTPAEAMASPRVASDGIKRAWRLACEREGINPRTPARLPRLFALDARLGIVGGFVYVLDCMAAGQRDGNTYCASDIGCGGGCGGDSGSSFDTGSDAGSGGSGGDGGSGCGGGCGGGGD